MPENDEILKIWDRLVTTIENATVDNGLLKKRIGDLVIKTVTRRSKAGFGVGKGKSQVQLAPLKDSTIRSRRWLKKKGRLQSDTTPEKSNMTATGEALKDLTMNIDRSGVNVVFGSEESDVKIRNQSNREIMNLTREEEQAVTNLVADAVVAALKKF